MTKVEKDDLIAALRLRYDYYSAQTIFDAALARAELRDQDLYSEVELAAFREALSRVGDRLTVVHERIASLIGDPPQAAPRPDARPEPIAEARPEQKPAPEPEPEPKQKSKPKAEARAEAKAETKVETKVETKPAAKPEPKPEPKPQPAPEPAPASDTGVATIALVGVELDPDEHVLVCGNFVDWNPDRAILMTRSGDGWQAKVPARTDISFKFVRKRADGTLLWEPGDDRALVGAHLEATWRGR